MFGVKLQGAFHALRPNDVRRRPDFLLAYLRHFFNEIGSWSDGVSKPACLPWRECEVVLDLSAVSFDNTHCSFIRN